MGGFFDGLRKASDVRKELWITGEQYQAERRPILFRQLSLTRAQNGPMWLRKTAEFILSIYSIMQISGLTKHQGILATLHLAAVGTRHKSHAHCIMQYQVMYIPTWA